MGKPSHFDAIILGMGGVGSAAAYHLARRGCKVLALDRFPGGHNRGSSHGDTRIVRQAYFEHSDYVPLLLAAYDLWAELEQCVGEKLFSQVGVLQLGPADGHVVRGVQQAAALHGLNVETLAAEEIRRRFPAFGVSDELCGVFEPLAGFVRVERAVLAHLMAAAMAGAELRAGVEVQQWRASGNGVEIITNRGSFFADRLIVTAGAWAASLLNDLDLPLHVLRKHLYWYGPAHAACSEEAGCPAFLYELPEGVFYGVPQCDSKGVKIGEHSGGEVVMEPLTDPRQADSQDMARVDAFRRRWLHGVGSHLRERSVCHYTMSPDGHFIVDRHPQHSQVVFAAGLSGHGFKFTPVLGDVLAELALEGTTGYPVGFLSLNRF